ncbi:DUF4328 domain-containing protein [Pimelobacter simplex]|uniref:DUF4328 domain-containing protein n=1 Tax=Nocardioides simplex TaxID=2045 RepID=UPI00382E9281
MLPDVPPARTAPTGLGLATVVVAGAVALVQVVRALAALEARRVRDAAVEVGADPALLTTTYDVVSHVSAPLLVIAWVVGCLWLQRARDNAELISPGVRQRRQAGWVWLGWFIPFANVWVPYQVVGDVQRASVPAERRVGLGWWWAAWLLFLVLPLPLESGDWTADPDLADLLPALEGLAAVAAVAAAVLWGRVVLRVTLAQETALPGGA